MTDGTQDPVPPRTQSDPLAGLVTGASYEPEPLRVRVTEPPMPDISAVREAMASLLDENSELTLSAIGPAADFFSDSSAGEPPAPPRAAPVAKVPVTQVPTQVMVDTNPPATPAEAAAPVEVPAQVPTRGAVTRVSTPPVGIPAPRSAGTVPVRARPPAATPGERSRRIRLPRGFMRRRIQLPPGTKVQSSAGSVTLILVLLGVMVVLGIVFLASFIGTIASLFD